MIKRPERQAGSVAASPARPSASTRRCPKVGERPPKIDTLTAADVGNDLEKIDTRVPPDQMHKVDFAEVLGKKPIVLVFATPALCQSRVCGPVVDVAQQVADEYEPKADFIHQEVYVDNEIDQGDPSPAEGVRPADRAVDVPDRQGRRDQGPPRGRLRGGRTGRSDEDDRAWLNSRTGRLRPSVSRVGAHAAPQGCAARVPAWEAGSRQHDAARRDMKHRLPVLALVPVLAALLGLGRPRRPRRSPPSRRKKPKTMVFEACRHGCQYRTIQKAVDAAGSFTFKNKKAKVDGRRSGPASTSKASSSTAPSGRRTSTG